MNPLPERDAAQPRPTHGRMPVVVVAAHRRTRKSDFVAIRRTRPYDANLVVLAASTPWRKPRGSERRAGLPERRTTTCHIIYTGGTTELREGRMLAVYEDFGQCSARHRLLPPVSGSGRIERVQAATRQPVNHQLEVGAARTTVGAGQPADEMPLRRP